MNTNIMLAKKLMKATKLLSAGPYEDEVKTLEVLASAVTNPPVGKKINITLTWEKDEAGDDRLRVEESGSKQVWIGALSTWKQALSDA